MDTLPIEILFVISDYFETSGIWYQFALAYPKFGRETLKRVIQLRAWFQFCSVKITCDKIEWFQNNQLHRNNAAAVEYIFSNGEWCKKWYYRDQLHRENNRPAIKWSDGDKSWWYKGQRHRENDKPALRWANGEESWWYHGQRHRENDKPAVVLPDGTKQWFYHALLHRENASDGTPMPAIEWANGEKDWYYKNQLIKSTETTDL